MRSILAAFVIAGVSLQLFAVDLDTIRSFQPSWKVSDAGVDFKTVDGSLLMEGETPNGEPFRAVFDTGAPFALVYNSSLKKFEHEYLGVVADVTLPSLKDGRIQTVSAKLYLLHGVQFSGTGGDLVAFGMDGGITVNDQVCDLLVGISQFSNSSFSLDFSEGKLLPGAEKNREIYWVNMFKNPENVPTVLGRSEQKLFPVVIDTGSPISLRGFPDPIHEHSDEPEDVIFDSLQIAGIKVSYIHGKIVSDPEGKSMLGIDFLKGYDWTIDIPNQRVGMCIDGLRRE
jgi:hypothetical protein